MIFDTHSHCYWDTLESRIEEIIENMRENNVSHAVQIGCDRESSKKAIDLARRYPGIFFATVGYHPESAQDDSDYSSIDSLEKLILENREFIVGIGETGLDFHYLDGTLDGKIPVNFENLTPTALKQIENQKNWWRIQHELAIKYDLPLIIHTRDARDSTIDFIRENEIRRAVMHCFSEDWDFAYELLKFSDQIYFSFSGILTYKRSEKLQNAVKNIPISRIIVETDAPFLPPQPVRGKVNEPAFVRYNLEKVAEIKGFSIEETEDLIYKNSLRFFSGLI